MMAAVSSVRAVPETTDMHGDELSADDARHTVRHAGLLALGRTAFLRVRYGDGFSHARTFALQLALATVPLIIAGSGLATAIGAESVAEVVSRTVVAVFPGTGDQLLADVVDRAAAPAPAPGVEPGDDQPDTPDRPGEDLGELAVVFGLVTAFVAMTSAFAQLERGANRV